jgi:class 3 adenylate cyclase
MVRREREVALRVSREALWKWISDTDRLNREIGLPPVRFTYLPRSEGGTRLRGEARIAGRLYHYDEEPYCWVAPEYWSVRRVLDDGPLREVRMGVSLTEMQEGTKATAWCEADPQNLLTLPVARTFADMTVNSLTGMLGKFEAFLNERITNPYPRHSGVPAAVRGRIEEGLTRLRELGGEESHLGRLGRLLSDAPIEDVVNIRPYRLADEWGVGRQDLLRTCLLAVRAGLLELRWRVLCPACRGAGEAVPYLRELQGKAHCSSCNLFYGPEFDRSVEVCFSVAPRVRRHEIGEATYCVGGPGQAPHILLQAVLPPDKEMTTTLDVAPGKYTISSPQATMLVQARLDGTGGAEIPLHSAQGQACFRDTDCVLPGKGTWHWQNRTNFPVLVRLEMPGWLTDVATAATVTNLPMFRDLFSSEVLSPDTEIAVRQIAILFTDLKGSTAMYAARGDAPSYAAVREHFAFLRRIIEKHSGVIIKTIGDAIMAAFSDGADALEAALEIQEQAPQQPDPMTIKVGLHVGPALAVNGNGVLDYFGQVVNMASRIQNESVGSDIVIAESLCWDTTIRQRIAGLHTEPFVSHLRGTDAPLTLLRLQPQKQSSPEGKNDEP